MDLLSSFRLAEVEDSSSSEDGALSAPQRPQPGGKLELGRRSAPLVLAFRTPAQGRETLTATLGAPYNRQESKADRHRRLRCAFARADAWFVDV